MLVAALGEHAFWITSRAAGVVALVAASLGGDVRGADRRRDGKGRGLDLRVIHEALSLTTIARSSCTRSRCSATATCRPARRHHDPVRRAATGGCGPPRDRRRLVAGAARPARTTSAGGSAPRAGAGCIASPRSPGCSGSCTGWARAPSRARPGSWLTRGRRRCPRPALLLAPAGAPAAPGAGRPVRAEAGRALRAASAAPARCARPGGGARGGGRATRRQLLEWHDRFTRFDPAASCRA